MCQLNQESHADSLDRSSVSHATVIDQYLQVTLADNPFDFSSWPVRVRINARLVYSHSFTLFSSHSISSSCACLEHSRLEQLLFLSQSIRTKCSLHIRIRVSVKMFACFSQETYSDDALLSASGISPSSTTEVGYVELRSFSLARSLAYEKRACVHLKLLTCHQ